MSDTDLWLVSLFPSIPLSLPFPSLPPSRKIQQPVRQSKQVFKLYKMIKQFLQWSVFNLNGLSFEDIPGPSFQEDVYDNI